MSTKKRKIGLLLSDKELKKRYPEAALASQIFMEDSPTELRLPCEVVIINYILGGGLAYGKIIEVYGDESSGKTLLAMNFIKVAQSMGGVGLWNDAECTFDGKWARANGLDLEKIALLPYENRIEIISDWIADTAIYWRARLQHNEPIVWVIDSLAVLEVLEAMETAQLDTKAEMGKRSFRMGEMLRKRTGLLARYGICALFVNQLRLKVGRGMFENPETRPMNQPMKYYASLSFGLYRGKRIKVGDKKGKEKWVGNNVYVRISKNKISAPQGNIPAQVYFQESGDIPIGYDKYFGTPDLLLEKKILKKKQGKYYRKDELVADSDITLLKKIRMDGEFRKKMLLKLEVNTPSIFRTKLDSISHNLYPVKVKKSSNEESN